MHKLRSLLTVLGLVFGVASVIVMLAVAEVLATREARPEDRFMHLLGHADSRIRNKAAQDLKHMKAIAKNT